MTLEFRIASPQGRCWYTAGETVSGTVSWTNKRTTAVSRIIVWLEGVLETSIKPTSGHEATYGNSKHFILARRQSLYPPSTASTNCRRVFGNGFHSFRFQLSFPGSSREEQLCQKCNSLLPPNFAFASDGIKASVRYHLRVVIERPGLLKPNLVEEQAVEYRPLLPFFCSPGGLGWGTSGRADIAISCLDNKDSGNIGQPSCRKSLVTAEVILPGPKVLRPGNPVNLSIAFIVPDELRISFTPIWIFGLSIRLKAKTAVTASTHVRAHVRYIDICNIQAILPLELRPGSSRVALPSGLWEHCIYPVATPSFQFCEAERSYELEVCLSFACSKAEETYKATTLVDIDLESGAIETSEPPPEYNRIDM